MILKLKQLAMITQFSHVTPTPLNELCNNYVQFPFEHPYKQNSLIMSWCNIEN